MEKGRVVTNDTNKQREIKPRLSRCYLALDSLSRFGVACENRIVICLHCLFSLANPKRSASHLLFSSSLLSFRSDVDCVISCLSRNLYQQRTITVNLANVYKVRRLAAGLCSPCLVFSRLCFLFFRMCFMCLCTCVSWKCAFEERGVSGREDLRVSQGRAAV